MEWTFTAAADRKILRSCREHFVFGEAAQQIASEHEDFAARLRALRPHITFYDPASASEALESERISEEDAVRLHGIDLARDGGAQLLCSGASVFVNLYGGSNRFPFLVADIERTLESNALAIAMTFSIPQLGRSRSGDIKFDQGLFLQGTPIFFGELPELALVRRAVP